MSFRSCVSSLATLVRVEVVAARKLPLRSADEEDFPSPYVIVDYVDKKKSTDVIQETISPRWRVGSSNKIFSFRVNPADKQIAIVVMDWAGTENSSDDRFIGSLRLNIGPLEQVEPGKKIEGWFDIEPPVSFTGLGSVLMRLADGKSGINMGVNAAGAGGKEGGQGSSGTSSPFSSSPAVAATSPLATLLSLTPSLASPSSSSSSSSKSSHVGQLQLRVWLEKRKVAIDKSPLWDAVRAKALEQVKSLLKQMTFKDLNQQDQHGDTVLHLAVSRKDWDAATTQILLTLLDDERLDVSATNEDDNTAFHYFCQKYSNISMIGPFDRLVERGADVHAVNKFGETPLHKAIFHSSLKLTLLDLLLQRGADPNAVSTTGETPLHYAVHLGREDVVKFLLQKGADFMVESDEGKTPYDVAKEENPIIAQRIKDTKEILSWLRRMDLLEWSEDFLAHDIFLYVLPDLTDDYLRRVLPEDADRNKVMQAVRRFVREIGSFKPSSQETQLKEDILRKLDLRKKESILRRSLNDHALKRLNAAAEAAASSNPPNAKLDNKDGTFSPNPLLVARDSVALLSRKLSQKGTLRNTLRNTRIKRTYKSILGDASRVSSIFEKPITNATTAATPTTTTPSSGGNAQPQHQVNTASLASIGIGLSGSPSIGIGLGSIGGGNSPSKSLSSTAASPSSTITNNALASGSSNAVNPSPERSPRIKPNSALRSTHHPSADSIHNTNASGTGNQHQPQRTPGLSDSAAQLQAVFRPLELNWEIDPLELEFTRSLGCGASGEVFLGKYRNKGVAIKILNRTQTDSDLDEFKKEFEVLIALQSPHAIRFYGACVAGQCSLVMEYAARGSLFDVMRAPDAVLGWDKFFKLAIGMAGGLADLHAHRPHQILHRDFKCLNLLVTEDWEIRLCDFGLSRFNTGSNMQTLSKCRGTYAYLAPEIYDCDVFTTKADVYALAIALWELTYRVVTGEYLRPYKEFAFIRMDFQTLVMAKKKNLRPTIPPGTPEGIASLIRACWEPDPRNRLEAIEVLEILMKLEVQYRADPKKWDKIIRKYAIAKLKEVQASLEASSSTSMDSTLHTAPNNNATPGSPSSAGKRRTSLLGGKSPKSSVSKSPSSIKTREARVESAPPAVDHSPTGKTSPRHTPQQQPTKARSLALAARTESIAGSEASEAEVDSKLDPALGPPSPRPSSSSSSSSRDKVKHKRVKSRDSAKQQQDSGSPLPSPRATLSPKKSRLKSTSSPSSPSPSSTAAAPPSTVSTTQQSTEDQHSIDIVAAAAAKKCT